MSGCIFRFDAPALTIYLLRAVYSVCSTLYVPAV